ncbi:hypothetical protein, partial [Dethiosulfovibrio acidaminovorans]
AARATLVLNSGERRCRLAAIMSPLFLRPMIQQPVLHLNLATYSVVHFSGSTINIGVTYEGFANS